MTEETLAHHGQASIDRTGEDSKQLSEAISAVPGSVSEQTSEGKKITSPWSSRKQRLIVGIGTGITAAAGVAAAAIGLSSNNSQEASNHNTTTPSASELRLPASEHFNAFGLTEGSLNYSNVKSFSSVEIGNANSSLNSDSEILLPLLFNPTERGIDFTNKSQKTADGQIVGKLSFSGIIDQTVVKAPFDGKVTVKEFGTDESGRYKIFEVKTTNAQGKELDVAMTIPENAQINPEINMQGDSIEVNMGQSLFTLDESTVLPTQLKHNMEISAFEGIPGDSSSLKQISIDLAKDPLSGKVASIGE
jgi:hypothetical protein